jgi:hypothetical protein
VQAPGLLWFVHNRLGPVVVDPAELDAIRVLLASGLEYDPMPHVNIGDEVEVVAGPMRGCHGHLVRKDPQSIAFVVSAINGCVRVSMPDASWITPVPKPRAAGVRSPMRARPAHAG